MPPAMYVRKPWGHEEMLFWGEYVVKLLHIRAGHRLSLQYHIEKTETLMVHRGIALIYLDGESRIYRAGEVIHVPAGVEHRIAAGGHGDVDIFEVSTPQLDDVVRLSDDYGRTSAPTPEGTFEPAMPALLGQLARRPA